MIPQKKFVNITSGVGGGAGVRLRDYILRLFTNTEFVPPGQQLEFADADSVGTYFGTTSPEYKRAAFYFGFISKNITKPNKLSFARWVDVAVAPKVFGNTAVKSLAAYTAVANGSLALDLGTGPQNVAGLNLGGTASLAAVAAAVQAAIRAVVAGGVAWTAATVTYDAVTNRFNLVSGQAAGAGTMAVTVPGAGTDLAPLLGWTVASGGIINNGSAIETITTTLSNSAELSNNFATFQFLPALSQAQVVEAAVWNKAQNNMFMYLPRADAASAANLSAALIGTGGVGVTLSPLATEYPEMLPAMVLASTDYNRRNATQNYMYQQAGSLTPSVLTAANSDLYDGQRVNYYGRTQAAGQLIDFYQRGVLMGLATDPVDMNVYANEIWMKDAAGAALLSLQLAMGKISANAQGRAQLVAALSKVATQGLTNGTVSVGKTLSVQQQLYVTQLTGDPVAWTQVQNSGYWLDCVMQSYVTVDGRTEWKAVYTLIYSKDDTVRKVEGSHVLI
jgi:hypothetical protein